MPVNRGKQFEDVVRKAFLKVPDVSIDRLHDQTTGYRGSQNICDFIVYRDPNEFYIECKSVHGVRLPFSNITDTQWYGLWEKSKIEGVYAGILCWFIDLDQTYFYQIQYLHDIRNGGAASVKCPNASATMPKVHDASKLVPIFGVKKRIFFEYDMQGFLDAVQFNRWIVN